MSDFDLYRSFLRRCAATLGGALLAVSPLLAGYGYALRSVGELTYSSTLARLSVNGRPMLWRSGYYDAGHHLKMGIGSRIAPRVAILGSSRVMQMRGRMFNKLGSSQFYNLGGGVTNFEDAMIAVGKLRHAERKPDLVILGIDFWWVQMAGNPTIAPGRAKIKAALGEDLYFRLFNFRRSVQDGTAFYLDQLQLLQSAWRDKRFREALWSGDLQEPSSGRVLVGLGAREGVGFRNDGSLRYWKAIEQIPELPEAKRSEALERLREGMYRGQNLSHVALDNLDHLLRSCRLAAIDVLVLLPPIDPVVFDQFRQDDESNRFWDSFAPEVRGISERYDHVFLDYTSKEGVTDRPAEFIDALHASDVTYARMLVDLMSDSGPQRLLSPYLDPSVLQLDIASRRSDLDLYGD